MYEETNKAIVNNRVKILDEYIDTGEMMPLKQLVKTEKDKTLEKHLNQARRAVTNNALPNNLSIIMVLL